MTINQARKRYPLVPADILKWAFQHIEDPRDLEFCLSRLEQSKRMQVKYGRA